MKAWQVVVYYSCNLKNYGFEWIFGTQFFLKNRVGGSTPLEFNQLNLEGMSTTIEQPMEFIFGDDDFVIAEKEESKERYVEDLEDMMIENAR